MSILIQIRLYTPIIIILLAEILIVIPMQIVIPLIIYDFLFQDGFRPFNRMGAVLEDSDKEVFDKNRKEQIDTFKRCVIFFNIFLLIIFISFFSLVFFDVDPNSSLARVVLEVNEILLIIIVILLFISQIFLTLKPPALRSMIAVVKAKGFSNNLVHNQISSLSRLDMIRNKDYQILIHSFYKRYYSYKYPTYHNIPYINYSIFKNDKIGSFDENKIAELLENYRSANRYLTMTVLPDLKFTPLWKPNKNKELMMYIYIILEILAFGFLFSVDKSNQSLHNIAIILVFIPVIFFWFPFRYLFILTSKEVERILTENNIEYTSENKFDKMVELVENEFPYVDL